MSISDLCKHLNEVDLDLRSEKKKRNSRPFIPTTTKEELQRIAGYSFDLIQEEGLCLDCIKAGGIYNEACRVGHEKMQRQFNT